MDLLRCVSVFDGSQFCLHRLICLYFSCTTQLSGKLIPLLLATSKFGYTTAFTPIAARNSSRNLIQGSKHFSNMADEVEAAKAAAAAYKSQDKDGAGPATAFDNILSGKWSSDKVYEDDLALAFREL